MIKKEKSTSMLHIVPNDIKVIFKSNDVLKTIWDSLTPLARNEWLCWIESAKKTDTRNRRISILCDKLLSGERRPCCWAGCPHR